MKKTQENQNEIIDLLGKMVRQYELESQKSGGHAGDDLQALDQWFEEFVRNNALELVGIIYKSELEGTDRAYFAFLILHGLFNYEHYVDLREKLAQRSRQLSDAEKTATHEIEMNEEERAKSFDNLIDKLQASNKAFADLLESIMQKGMKTIETSKRSAESEAMTVIKQKLKRK